MSSCLFSKPSRVGFDLNCYRIDVMDPQGKIPAGQMEYVSLFGSRPLLASSNKARVIVDSLARKLFELGEDLGEGPSGPAFGPYFTRLRIVTENRMHPRTHFIELFRSPLRKPRRHGRGVEYYPESELRYYGWDKILPRTTAVIETFFGGTEVVTPTAIIGPATRNAGQKT